MYRNLQKSSHRSRISECQRNKGFRVLKKHRVSHQIVKKESREMSVYTQIEEGISNPAIYAQKQKQIKDFIKTMKSTQESQTIQGKMLKVSKDNRNPTRDQDQDPQNQTVQSQLSENTNRQFLQRNSIGSKNSARTQTKSMFVNSLKCHTKPLNTLRQLEDKIDEIINEKLTKLCTIKPINGLERIKYCKEFDNSIKKLIQQLQAIKNNDSEEIDHEECIQSITQKINVLEKAIAESSTQSDLMKRFYFAKKSQKLSRKPLISQNNFALFKTVSILQRLSSSLRIDKNLNRSINLQTTSCASYKKPSKTDYVVDRHIKDKYTVNRQPLPRSTYSTEFFSYGAMQNYKHKQSNNIVPNNISMTNCKTTYSHHFQKPTITEEIFQKKDLDCYHDKFKNPNISFMKHSQKNQHRLVKKSKARVSDQQADTKPKFQQNRENLDTQVYDFLKKSFMSQSTRQFQLTKGTIIANTIKNKNLNLLKNVYRNYLRS